jgi:hypothetical protein
LICWHLKLLTYISVKSLDMLGFKTADQYKF